MSVATDQGLARLAELDILIRDRIAERDELIRRLRDTGLPFRTIAVAAGLTHAGVAKICGYRPPQGPKP